MNSNTEKTLDERIAEKPYEKVTIEKIEARIVDEIYYQPEGTTLTICVLKVDNGFTAVGEGACAHPSNFDPQIGKELARKTAIGKLWGHMGFALADKLMADKHSEEVAAL